MPERAKILIVDDKPFNVDYLQQELGDLGYETCSAANGQEVLAKVAAEAGQILVGPETVRRLGDRYRVASLGREHLKNVAEAIDIYCILSPFQEEA